MWFTMAKANKIGRITPSGVIPEFPIPTPNSFPKGISAGSDGTLWFTEVEGNKIGQVSLDGRVSEITIPRAGSQPQDIIQADDGTIWFTMYKTSEVISFPYSTVTSYIGRYTPRKTYMPAVIFQTS